MMIGEKDLFGPNNHSHYLIRWKPVNQETVNLITHQLTDWYEVSAVQEVHQVDEWERMSHNFRVSCTRQGNKEILLLRKHIANKNPEQLTLIEGVSKLLQVNGVLTPRTINSREGKTWIFVEGHYWQVFEYIEGDHFRGREQELLETAKYIALFHKAFAQSTLPVLPDRPYPWTRTDWNKIFEMASSLKNKTDQIVINHQSLIENAIERVEARRHESVNITTQPIHRDLHPHNTIFKDSSLKALLDFSDVSLGERARDVGNACHRFVRQYIVFEKKPWQEMIGKGLELFLKRYYEYYPLSQEEFSALPVFIYDELLGKLYYDLKGIYLDNDDRFVTGGQLEKMLTLLTEAPIIEKELASITL